MVPKRALRDILQQEIRVFLSKQPNSRALLSNVCDHVIKATGYKSKSSFYRYISEMKDVKKEKIDNKVYCFLNPVVSKPATLLFPQVDNLIDSALRKILHRSVKLLNLDDVDLGLFQLGKIFETEIKSYLLEVKNKGVFSVTSKDLSRLSDMIDCVDKNGIVKKKHHLTLLREHRNERAHGEIPDLEERKKLFQHAPFLADLYIEYIIFFDNERKNL